MSLISASFTPYSLVFSTKRQTYHQHPNRHPSQHHPTPSRATHFHTQAHVSFHPGTTPSSVPSWGREIQRGVAPQRINPATKGNHAGAETPLGIRLPCAAGDVRFVCEQCRANHTANAVSIQLRSQATRSFWFYSTTASTSSSLTMITCSSISTSVFPLP